MSITVALLGCRAAILHELSFQRTILGAPNNNNVFVSLNEHESLRRNIEVQDNKDACPVRFTAGPIPFASTQFPHKSIACLTYTRNHSRP